MAFVHILACPPVYQTLFVVYWILDRMISLKMLFINCLREQFTEFGYITSIIGHKIILVHSTLFDNGLVASNSVKILISRHKHRIILYANGIIYTAIDDTILRAVARIILRCIASAIDGIVLYVTGIIFSRINTIILRAVERISAAISCTVAKIISGISSSIDEIILCVINAIILNTIDGINSCLSSASGIISSDFDKIMSCVSSAIDGIILYAIGAIILSGDDKIISAVSSAIDGIILCAMDTIILSGNNKIISSISNAIDGIISYAIGAICEIERNRNNVR
eukprot:28094_1